jgi:(1->4)-alpha-D-glucan 1-alpha-D-glucosylmutase
VDYALRQGVLNELKARAEGAAADPLARELLADVTDGRIKLYVTWRGLACRRAHRELFLGGAYLPLTPAGDKAGHLCAFQRSLPGKSVVVVAPRLVAGLAGGAEVAPVGEVWGDTRLLLPPDEAGVKYRNIFTGELLKVERDRDEAALTLTAVLAQFPVAILERVG